MSPSARSDTLELFHCFNCQSMSYTSLPCLLHLGFVLCEVRSADRKNRLCEESLDVAVNDGTEFKYWTLGTR